MLVLMLVLVSTGVSGSSGDPLDLARNDEARLAFIVELIEDGEFAEAEIALEQSGAVANEDARWLNLRGLAVSGQGRLREAIGYFEAGLRQSPGLAALHRNLAISLTELGMRGRALSEFQQATELDAIDTEAWLGLCNLQLRLRRLDDARYSLGRLDQLAPEDARTWRARAELAERGGDPDAARRSWAWLEQNAPSTESARRLGDLLRSSDPTAALDHYRDCFARDSTAVDCREQASRVAMDLGEDQLAVELAAPALADLSESAYLNMLIAANNSSDSRNIELWIERREPGSAGAWGVVGLARRSDGRSEDAVMAVERGLELAEDADLYNLLGVLRVEAGDRESARRAWLRALEIDPGHGSARANLDEHPPAP
jgi:tetratricopeptide (TPR) repeat protein